MDDHRWLAVSPRHSVLLASEYHALIERPPARDFVVSTIETRTANGLPLMAAEIVIASEYTRRQHPLAVTYPLHFRKTYFAARMGGDPEVEFANSARAAEILGSAPPIGWSSATFRSCLVPGRPLKKITPFEFEPEDSNLRRASELPLATAAGLWKLAEEGFRQLEQLHQAGVAHGDAELQNFIVCPAPLEVILVDFEVAVQRSEVDAAAWQKRCEQDRAPLLREAIFLQAALGRQRGPLADAAWSKIERLVEARDRFARAIDDRSAL